LPSALDYDTALKKLQSVQQRRKSLSSAAQERFAARELGVDIKDFRAALKQRPFPSPAPRPVPVLPKPVLQDTVKKMTGDDLMQAAQKRLEQVMARRKSLDKAAAERLAAKEMGMDVKEFRSALRGSQVELHTYDEAEHLRQLRKILEPGHTDAFYKANTLLDYNDMQTQINCAKVVNSYEMRRRGYDVWASSGPAGLNNYELNRLWDVVDGTGHPKITYGFPNSPGHRTPVQQLMDEWDRDPIGSRYQVSVVWRGERSAHIFSAEKMPSGRIQFYDAQVHRVDASVYFNRISDQASVMAWRVDNAEPSPELIKLLHI
jgi:hypothetical protein